MGNLCVVAIPSEDDYVWKISSEKVPHMTILYLGDVAEVQNFAKIASYIQHAAGTSLRRFGLEVDHRGVLGQDEADVLFFSWDKWSGIQDVTNFRNYLLQDGNIRTSYDSVEQHDGFYPHLTLGYPPTPAKPDDRDYPGINYVQFDKVALWFGDYTGLEFPLKTRSMDYAEVSMDNIREDRSALVERILEHHGTKGMKWGVRRHFTAESRASRKVARGDKKFEKSVGVNKLIEIHNTAADAMNKTEISRINNKPHYKAAAARGDFLDETKPITKQYFHEYEQVFLSQAAKAAKAQGTNLSGTREYHIMPDPVSATGFSLTTREVKHAGDSTESIPSIPVTLDKKHRVTKFGSPPSTKHGELVVGDILSHHGIKGMKWGNRKNSIPAATGGGRQVRVTEHIDRVGKVRLKAEGGEGRPAHIDALSAAAAKQKLTKSGIHSLSNKELQDLTTRMNLEQNVGRLSSSGKSATSKFVTSTLQNVAKQQIAKLATDAASGQVENLLNKK